MRTRAVIRCLLVSAVVLGGCSDPYTDETTERPVASPARQGPAKRARAAGDALAPRRPPGRVPSTGTQAVSPRALARSYAERSLNWTWRDPEAPYRTLLPLSDGPLRDDLVRARAAVRRDDTIARDRLGSRGRFVAVDVQGAGRTRRLVVVVTEEALIDGRGSLEGPRHRVYLARARQARTAWEMVGWTPAP